MPPKEKKKPVQNKPKDDKSFGQKNKKGAQTQKAFKGQNGELSDTRKFEEKERKLENEKKKKEEADLMREIFSNTSSAAGKVVTANKGAMPSDPSKQICAFFKQGLCQKGRKCKFSHDLNLEVKAVQHKMQEIDLYTDQRKQLNLGKELQDMVDENSKAYKCQIPTEIVCKHFLDAVDNDKYGWRWICPNGYECHYRHCLPPGFILKKDMAKIEKEDLSLLEEKIDEQMIKLDHDKSKKVTFEQFMEWKEKRRVRKEQEKEEELKEKTKKIKKTTGGKNHLMTGLAMFQADPSMFQVDEDDDGIEDDIDYTQRDNGEDGDNDNSKGIKDTRNKFKAIRKEDEHKDIKEEETKEEQENNNNNQEEEESKNSENNNSKSDNNTQQEEGEQNNQEDSQNKKKKKKKKKSGEVDINDDVFLNEAD